MKSHILVVALITACGAHGPAVGGGDDSGSGKGDGDGSGSDAGTSGAYIIDETFNEVATGFAPGTPWVVAQSPTGSVTAAEVPYAADKSIAIVKPDTSGTSSLATSFAPQSGRVVFEAKVKAGETAGFKAIPYIYDANGAAVASISLQDGNLNAHIGATTTLVQTFAANVWYRVRVVVDTTQGTFDLYVDGVRKEHAVALRTASASVGKVSYFMDGANTGTLYVDNVKVYTEAAYIGAPPSPVFDARDYGAKGDGVTNDTAAIQAAADAAAGTGGSVVLSGGTFLSGTVTLGSKLTLFVDSSAVLLGSPNPADYPTQTPATGNTQLSNTQRALLYAPSSTNLTIDGGGVIDGQGDSFDNTKP